MKSFRFLALVLILATGYCVAQPHRNTPAPSPPKTAGQPTTQTGTNPSEGMAALQKAATADKYLFILFSDANDEQTRTIRKTLATFAGKKAGKVEWIAINRKVPEEKSLVEKLGVQTAPMPLVLAVAPNGAITGGFNSQNVSEQTLEGAIVSPGPQKILKSMQHRRYAMLSIQNKLTKNNEAAMKGVTDFKAAPKYSSITDAYTLNPSAPEEADFLKQIQVDPKTQEAVTILFAPPGTIITKVTGATSKEVFISALQKASSGGCGPGGCGPGGCK